MSETAARHRSTDSTAAGRIIKPHEPLYGDILEFLHQEAELLDEDRHWDWLGLVADDIVYQMPLRSTVYRRDGDGVDPVDGHFEDDKASLTLRVRRNMDIESAYDRDPLPRVRRMISNVRVVSTNDPDEYTVTSYELLLRNRFGESQSLTTSGKRTDLLRLTADGWRLARRVILLDQAVLTSEFLTLLM